MLKNHLIYRLQIVLLKQFQGHTLVQGHRAVIGNHGLAILMHCNLRLSQGKKWREKKRGHKLILDPLHLLSDYK